MVNADEVPVNEDNPLRPVTHYGVSKACQTMLCLTEGRSAGIELIVFRPFNVVGPGMPRYLAFGSFAGQIAEAEVAGKQCEVMARGSLESRRDFIDVRDVADAVCLLACVKNAVGVYNVCTGKLHSVREGVAVLKQHSRVKCSIVQRETGGQAIESPGFYGDNKKITQAISWNPRISFEKSLEDTLEYERGKGRQPLM
jgi:GDP-4-dehydro-6-deoxy-D-mannose reductase